MSTYRVIRPFSSMQRRYAVGDEISSEEFPLAEIARLMDRGIVSSGIALHHPAEPAATPPAPRKAFFKSGKSRA